MNSEQSYQLRLNDIQSKASIRIDDLHNNFNTIKDEMLSLNKEYEKMNQKNKDFAVSKAFQEEMIELIAEETKVRLN